MTPLACRDAPAPAAAPARSSHHASHRVRCCQSYSCLTLSDSFTRRTGARTHRLRAVHYLRALLRRSVGPLGRIRITSLMGGRARVPGGKARTGTRRPSPCRVSAGRVQPWRSRTNRTTINFLQRGRVMATRCGYRAPQRPVALCAWAGQP